MSLSLPEMLSEAIDIVPLVILAENKSDWDPTNPVWQTIGQIGLAIGLEWGGRWKGLNNGLGDPSHFQYIKPSKEEPKEEVTNEETT